MISVIVPIYNGEAYIARCLRSILANTYRDLELIVVANACRDNTVGICRGIAQEDDRVRVIETDVPGVSHARNLGIDAARGEYISFVDGDDYISPVMMEHFINCANETGWDIVFANYIEGTEETYDFPTQAGSRHALSKDEYLLNTYLPKQFGLAIACNRLFRKAVMEKFRFNEQYFLGEDRNFMVKVACSAGSMGILDEGLYYYWHGIQNSASRVKDAYFKMNALYSLQDDVAFMEEHYPECPAYREYAAASLLENAGHRLKDARKKGLKDIIAEVRPIVKKSARVVRKSRHIPKKTKYRILLEHDCPPLYRLAVRVLGK